MKSSSNTATSDPSRLGNGNPTVAESLAATRVAKASGPVP